MSSSANVSNCPHVLAVGSNTWDDVYRKKQTVAGCERCGAGGPNLWLCLHSRCLFVGCGESAADHSTEHSEVRGAIKSEKHSLTLNMTTMRIWCYECECEVFKDNNNPALLMRERSLSLTPLHDGPVSPSRHSQHSYAPSNLTPDLSAHDTDTDDDDVLSDKKPRGLTGLQNIGNTCYLNAGLQALSNCPPLTRFFIDCPGYVNAALSAQQPAARLSRSYLKLVQDMWHRKRRSYLVPSTVAQGIKTINPMFRGYTQQDTQEFLRCFMDQLHEELKTPEPDMTPPTTTTTTLSKEDAALLGAGDCVVDSEPPPPRTISATNIASPAEDSEDYETCDSALSSERSSVEQHLDHTLDDSITLDNKNHPTATSKNRPKSMVSVEESDSGFSTTTSLTSLNQSCKNIKDNVNQQKQQGGGGNVSEIQILPISEKLADLEKHRNGGEHSENPETEPLQAKPKLTRSRSSSRKASESEGKVVSKPASAPPTHKVGPQAAKKKKAPVQYRSVISDIFDGKILSSVQCLTCERISSSKEMFQDLSLPIPSKDHLHMIHHAGGSPGPAPTASAAASTPPGAVAGHKGGTCGEVALKQGWMTWITDWMKSWFWGPKVTLNDCLAAFFSQDELKGDNMYSCEKCKKLRNGVKYSKVLELPEVMCIHLKRFRLELMFSSKISSYVEFPLEGLDMRPYLHKDCKDTVTQYDLVGAICHHGTAGGGHYTAFALNYLNERWYEFDDQYVTEVDMQQVENCEAYVLFYRKKNDDMMAPRLRAKQILEHPDYSDSFMKFYISRQWINRFNTFAEPGPITNRDFLCRHGGVHPHRWNMVDDLAENVPQKLWTYLHGKFGGGPAVSHLYQCETCQHEMDTLKRRQRSEMEMFVELHELFKNEENPAAIYAISMTWFKDWESFVKARTDEPPGPIDNSKIAVTKHGVTSIQHNSDYGQLSAAMWKFLLEIYGGGPELALKSAPTPPAVTLASAAGDAGADNDTETSEEKA